MNNNAKWFKNLVDDKILSDNLIFISLFIAVYENFSDYVVYNIESFLCEESIENGEYVIKKTQVYRDEIKNRVVDDKNNKDITKASFLWLKDNTAISGSDYELFLKLKGIRNKYAHELTSIILSGIDEKEDIKLFFDMIALYKKITKWWFINIEAPILGCEVDEEAEIYNSANGAFDLIINVLYNGKSEEYKKMLEELEQNGVPLHGQGQR
ncbi:MAG: hypothetical protein IJ149_07920 [Oscillospiraceae bacterium]|nr:hypothetical protein [Oscillospiraceae bacterium]